MNTKLKSALVAVAFWPLLFSTVLAAPPALVRSEPADGAKGVSTSVGVLRFWFDKNMKQNSWTFWQSDKAEFPAMKDADDAPWRDPRCIELQVGKLKPGTTYAVQLNSASKQGFRSAQGDEPLPPTVISFTTGVDTGSDTGAQQPVGKTDMENALRVPTTAPSAPQASGATPPADKSLADLRPRGSNGGAGDGRPQCPQGWTDFKHPLIGMQACVPGDYWVRLRGGTMLTVEKQGYPGTLAFMMPFRPRSGVRAGDIAQHFARFVAESEPRFQARIVGDQAPDLAVSNFTSIASDQPTEGRFCTIIAAGGSMAFVIGVSAPKGQLDREMPTLKKIARSFGFVPPVGSWVDYQSPAGGFTMKIPRGWPVQSSDGQTHKDDIDWIIFDPKTPTSRVFQWCPRFCPPQLLQDPLHAMRGYQAAQFRNHEEVLSTSLGQISQNVKLLKMNVNQPLTQLFRRMNQQVAQLLAALNAGRVDVIVYDCLASAQFEGKPVVVAFLAGIQTMGINAGISGQLMDLRVTLRGWCAEPERFVSESPVLEKICASMQLTPAFIRNVVNGNEQATAKIRETYAYMNKIDDQIRQSRWDTMDAIAEMNYDNLRESGGYVNEKTGRIEQISPEKAVKNSRGEYVSREEVERGTNPDSATVLRDAYSNDYMRGVYGRIEF